MFFETMFGALLCVLITDYATHSLPKHLRDLVIRRLRKLYPQKHEWFDIFKDFTQELDDEKSALKKTIKTCAFLIGLEKPETIDPPTSPPETSNESEDK